MFSFIKKSIAYKTISAIIVALLFIVGIMGVYVYNIQTSIIDKIQSDKKETILRYINNDEKKAIQETLKIINKLSVSIKNGIADALYNADDEAAKNILKQLLQNQNIVGVEIFDLSVNEDFLVAYKKNNKIIFTNKFLNSLKKYRYFKFDLIVEGEKLGYFKVFYDTSSTIKKIKALKDKEIALFYKKYEEIHKEVQQELIKELLGFIIGGIIVIILINILIRKFVNQPLNKFKAAAD